jgi:hypothetical protein
MTGPVSLTLRRTDSNALVRLSPIRMSMLISPQCSERISIAKTMHEMHVWRLRISISRLFCCFHCSCCWYYCQSLITVLHYVLRSFRAEPSSNDHSNTKQHHRKEGTEMNLKKIHIQPQLISAATSLSSLYMYVSVFMYIFSFKLNYLYLFAGYLGHIILFLWLFDLISAVRRAM